MSELAAEIIYYFLLGGLGFAGFKYGQGLHDFLYRLKKLREKKRAIKEEISFNRFLLKSFTPIQDSGEVKENRKLWEEAEEKRARVRRKMIEATKRNLNVPSFPDHDFEQKKQKLLAEIKRIEKVIAQKRTQ